MCNKI